MRRQMISAAFAVAVTVAQASMAADAPPEVPSTPPAAPATQQPADAERNRVLVAPFVETNDMQRPDWINRAIQQAVVDDLSALSAVEVVPSDPASAVPTPQQAQAAGIKYIVRGSIQRLNGQIRVSGRIQSVVDGKSVGGFKATGSQQQLFAIEDSIEQQLKRVLAPMEADLETPQPVGVGLRGTIPGGANSLPPQPIRGVYEGSDLQRALDDRDFLNRSARRSPTQYPPVYEPPPTYPVGYGGPTYYPPVYPGYGYGGGYGGYGWGWGWGGGTNVIIVKPGGGHGGGSGGGGSVPIGPSLQQVQTARIRNAAVYGGASSNVVSPLPPRAPAPGTKHP